MGKDKVVTMRMSEEDRKALEKDAKDEQRSISNFLMYCWKQWKKVKKKKV
jgi:uncharacterized protein (DUF1778 family)